MLMSPEDRWDVAVIGAGPAGLAAAREAANTGASTIVLERAVHPRYKTCGGGLIGGSLAAVEPYIDVPSRADIRSVTFTHNGRQQFTRHGRGPKPLLRLVQRTEFDDALREAAVKAGAVVRQRTTVRGIIQHHDHALVRLADGTTVEAATIVGADGSAGVTSRHVGVEVDQVDLGLEVEVPIPPSIARRWRDRLLLDWGPIPGSYGWVFPKGDSLTVGVIASRGLGDRTRAYLRGFVHRLGLAGIEPVQDSGHLTRCRSATSPLRSGRVIVAGDAAGLLEPFTREGISFALRSGALAGIAAAKGDLDGYCAAVNETLVPDMQAGFALIAAHERRPALFHAGLATPPGWAAFAKFCRGELTFGAAMRHPSVRYAVERAGR